MPSFSPIPLFLATQISTPLLNPIARVSSLFCHWLSHVRTEEKGKKIVGSISEGERGGRTLNPGSQFRHPNTQWHGDPPTCRSNHIAREEGGRSTPTPKPFLLLLFSKRDCYSDEAQTFFLLSRWHKASFPLFPSFFCPTCYGGEGGKICPFERTPLGTLDKTQSHVCFPVAIRG